MSAVAGCHQVARWLPALVTADVDGFPPQDSIGIKMPDVVANTWTQLWVGAMIAMCIITAVVRKKVREDRGIDASGMFTSCPALEDACCGLFCTHCTQCLLLRQGGSKYSLCSEDGLP